LRAQLTRDLFAIAKFLVLLTRGAHTSAWTALNLLHIVNQLCPPSSQLYPRSTP